MPINHYFGGNISFTPEQLLVEDLVIESIKIHGQDLYWLPRISVAEDALYGEDQLSKYTEAHVVEMYVKSIEGFEGEGDLLSRFGIEVRDQVTFVLSIRRFDQLGTVYARPREGDLVYHPLSKKLFMIQFVEHESLFYQTGALQVYELRCELFEYSNETILTGIQEIDDTVASLQFTFGMTLSPTIGVGGFTKGMILQDDSSNSASTVRATIMKTVNVVPPANAILTLAPIKGGFTANMQVITSDASGAGFVDPTFNEIAQYQQTPSTVISDANVIQIEANTILDTSEKNPFGDF